MLAILSTCDYSNVTNKDISFLHIIANREADIEVEAKPYALAFARKLNLKKVYLLFGEKGKIIYDFSI